MTPKRFFLLIVLVTMTSVLSACDGDGFPDDAKGALKTAVRNLGGNTNYDILSTEPGSGNLGNFAEAWCIVTSPIASDVGELTHFAMSREGKIWQMRATNASPGNYIEVIFVMWNCENYETVE
jgi:hypothetical protein